MGFCLDRVLYETDYRSKTNFTLLREGCTETIITHIPISFIEHRCSIKLFINKLYPYKCRHVKNVLA